MKEVSTMETHSTSSQASLEEAVCAMKLTLLITTHIWTFLDPAQDQVRKGPTTVTEFEVTLADMCVRLYTFLCPTF